MNTTKLCTKCNCEKEIKEFHKDKQKKDGLCSQCKTCKIQNVKTYSLKNSEKIKDYKKQWALKNQDRLKEDRKIYVKNNKDRIAETKKEWAEKNKERVFLTKQKYYLRNTEKVKERAKIFSKTEKGIINARLVHLRRRERIKKVPLDKNDLKELISRYKNCYWCNDKLNGIYHIDHYIPVSKGGTNEINNLVLSCPTCNLRKNAKDPHKFALEMGRLL